MLCVVFEVLHSLFLFYLVLVGWVFGVLGWFVWVGVCIWDCVFCGVGGMCLVCVGVLSAVLCFGTASSWWGVVRSGCVDMGFGSCSL